MAKRFTVSQHAIKRLHRLELDAAERLEQADVSRAEEALAYKYGCYLTNEEVASALGCTVKTLSTLRLPRVRIGHTIRYSAEEVASFIQAHLHAEKSYA